MDGNNKSVRDKALLGPPAEMTLFIDMMAK